MAGITYTVNVLIASEVGSERGDVLYLPLVGPWLYINEVCDNDSSGCSFLVLHSLTHTTGVILLAYGLLARRQILARNDAAWMLTPARVGEGYGFAALAKF